MTNHTFNFISDVTAKMSNNSVTIVPTEDMKDYAKCMLSYVISLRLMYPSNERWKEIVLDSDSASSSIEFAHRITKIVKLINDYHFKDSAFKIEYDFISKTHQYLAEYEAKNGNPLSPM